MRLIKQANLHFQQGNSDKVYEVDLCEVGENLYVVNFRYGRRGSNLRDGTKTATPVSYAQAEQIFDDLVSSKTSKGYRDTSNGTPAQPPPVQQQSTVPPAQPGGTIPPDPRVLAILTRLQIGVQDDRRWKLARAAWRAGEMGITHAEPYLCQLVGQGDDMLDYNIAAALARCGSPNSLDALRIIKANTARPQHVRRMAAEAIRQLLPENKRTQLVDEYIGHLPAWLQETAQNGPGDEFYRLIKEQLEAKTKDAFKALEMLYFIDNEHVRPALLRLLRELPLATGCFLRLRRIFKSAEIRRDAEVFGLLAYRFETEKSTSQYYRRENKSQDRPAFQPNTKFYLRHRIWRTLERLGQLDDADYVRLAVGVLLSYTDADAKNVSRMVQYDYQTWQPHTTCVDHYGRYWAFNKILYGNSPRYEPASSNKYFLCKGGFEPGGPEPEQREEAFPHLWSSYPTSFLHLLDESQCEVVHRFAAKGLRSCTEFCRAMDVDVLIMLVAAPYDVTVELGFDIAKSRYDASNPDRRLVGALINSVYVPARQQARQWIDVQREYFFRNVVFTISLMTSPLDETRRFVRNSLRFVTLDPQTADDMIYQSAQFLQQADETDAEIASDVVKTLIAAFGERLRYVDDRLIRQLLAHKLPVVQVFAGELVLVHPEFGRQPPVEILQALVNATDAEVRAIGLRIISQMPDETLQRSVNMLFGLIRHEKADVRNAAQPIVKRVANIDGQFGSQLAEKLVTALLVPGAAEGVPGSTAHVLCEDLKNHLQGISSETVLQLLRSRSEPAQEVGGLLLPTNVDTQSLPVSEIIQLGNHDVLLVREACWQMCRADVDRLRQEMNWTVRILDARWDDTREFGREFFDQHFQNGELTPEILVGICDSIREDVQRYGQKLITQRFEEEHGPEYLRKLSEHPTTKVQFFATNFLDRFGRDDPQQLRQLEPFFVSVLSRVNKARVAKSRILDFLANESKKSEEAARVVAGILSQLSQTCAIGDRAVAIEIMVDIADRYPDVPLPIERLPVEVR